MRSAVLEYVNESQELTAAVGKGIEVWVRNGAPGREETGADPSHMVRFATEHVLWMRLPDERASPISVFAQDEANPPELRSLARQRAQHVLWRLW
ncbi:MAG TPA: hypothetical protein VFD49_07475 [Candidatus Dormibacteraeota bacterium]|nr:hypothetical protein [Candidatus Dormibacteraeota bacterium]